MEMGGNEWRRLKMEMDRKGGWQKGGVGGWVGVLRAVVVGGEVLNMRMISFIKYV